MNNSKLSVFLCTLLPCMTLQAATLSVNVQDASGKALADTVIYLETGAPVSPPAIAEISIEQQGKEFHPFVSVAPVGTVARFPNKDGIGHHVYSFSPAKPFELPLSENESSMTVTFDQPGIVTIGCNIHDWMVGYINIVNTPYYGKTGADGNLQIENLPAGDYRVFAWHPGNRTGVAVEQAMTTDGTGSVQQQFRLEIKPEVFWKPARPPENEEEQY